MSMGKIILPYLLLLPLFVIPFIYSHELYNGIINAKQIGLYAGMSLLLAGTGVHLIFTRRLLQISFNRVDVALLVFYVYLSLRAATTPFIPMVNNARFINTGLCFLLYFIIRYWLAIQKHEQINGANENKPVSEYKNLPSLYPHILNLLILSGLGQAIWGLLQLYGILPSFNSNFKITGTFYNPAPYALFLAVIFPLALGRVLFLRENQYVETIPVRNLKPPISLKAFTSLIFKFSHYLIFKFSYYLSLITIFSILLVLPATMIRAAWLGSLAGSFVVLQYRYHFIQTLKQLLNTYIKKIIAFGIFLLIGSLLIAGLYILKKGSSTGKLLIWEVTLGKIAEKPIFGHGIARFEAEYNNWQANYFKGHPKEMEGPKGVAAGNTKYCFNEYLEMSAETGMVGLLLFISIISCATIALIKVLINPISNSQHEYISSGGAVISILTCALISFPFYSLPTQIIFFILLGVLSFHIETGTIRTGYKNTFRLTRFMRIGLFLVLFSFSILLIRKTVNEYKNYYAMDEGVLLYGNGSYKEAAESFNEISSELKYSGAFLQYYGKTLYLNEEYKHGKEILERASQFTSDEVLHTTLGDTYKVLKQYPEAETAYQHASFMVPHKIYPLYLLVKLYQDTGEPEKAKSLAIQILNKDLKVASEATEEIRAEMSMIVGNEN